MILDELAAYARIRVEEARKRKPLEEIKAQALALARQEAFKAADGISGDSLGDRTGGDSIGGMAGGVRGKEAFRFERALQKPGLSFICEVKKASPSKGIIAEDFPYLEIAKAYEAAGADCISCLTEPKWFLGSDEIFCRIRQQVSLPMIRKDFTVDEYQIYEAKIMGADAVLLICALLDTETVRDYLRICDSLGMSALVETHDEAEIKSALAAGARLIGVNNRNLKNFTVDFGNSARLREMIPEGITFVAESGVRGREDIRSLASLGADAALVGEALMRAEDKGATLADFRTAADCGV